ncbi:LCP family protein [Streptomyces apocyni]|uniref:LCP family protein n=1 Tax=Streptomyces apocyni TaxID=2654677 RepID=UPI0012EA7BB4|nr:LCP family protein [Streptomyces apocyni]
MNDRQYDPYPGHQEGQQYEIVGYDEYGRPVYQQVAWQQQYDPYAPQVPQQGYGYDPYAATSTDTGQQQPVPGYDPYAAQQPQQQPQQPQQPQQQTQQQPQQTQQTAWVPQQHQPEPQRPHEPSRQDDADRADRDDRDYRTEMFAFIEEPDDDSEDVIDWLKFTESRTERREEARRRGRNRMVALLVVLALALTGGVGYLWHAGKLPGLSSGGSDDPVAGSGPQKRDVIVVHLHNTKEGGTSTALLVNNTTTGQGTTVLLPNSLAVTSDDGSTTTTLGKSVDEDGTAGTREAIDALLGTRIEGSWRLDTPYLNNLVELVGNIEIDTDTDVPDPKAPKKGESPLVSKGEQQTLSGPMAVAYATYRAPDESESAQLERFGAVLRGVLRKLSTDPKDATLTVKTLAQILDPSLTEKDLGASLAKLAEHAKEGAYDTRVLPVQEDGALTAKATDAVVKDVLGGKVKSPEQGAAVRVNVSGDKEAVQSARVSLVNGGYTVVSGGGAGGAGGADGASATLVTYADSSRKAEAVEVAKTLGLSASAVQKDKVAANADIAVVLGADYETE